MFAEDLLPASLSAENQAMNAFCAFQKTVQKECWERQCLLILHKISELTCIPWEVTRKVTMTRATSLEQESNPSHDMLKPSCTQTWIHSPCAYDADNHLMGHGENQKSPENLCMTQSPPAQTCAISSLALYQMKGRLSWSHKQHNKCWSPQLWTWMLSMPGG